MTFLLVMQRLKYLWSKETSDHHITIFRSFFFVKVGIWHLFMKTCTFYSKKYCVAYFSHPIVSNSVTNCVYTCGCETTFSDFWHSRSFSFKNNIKYQCVINFLKTKILYSAIKSSIHYQISRKKTLGISQHLMPQFVNKTYCLL